MREIIPGRLWLGHVGDLYNPRPLLDAGVEAVVDLAYESTPAVLPRGLVYCRFPLIDGAGNRLDLLRAALDATVSLLRRDLPLLVACGAGMSRSPALLAAALAIVRSQPPERCLQNLIAGHPHDVSPTLWADIQLACHAR